MFLLIEDYQYHTFVKYNLQIYRMQGIPFFRLYVSDKSFYHFLIFMPQRYITILKKTMFYKKKLCLSFLRQSFSEIILAKRAKKYRFDIDSVRPFEDSQVTAGGAASNCFSLTLESNKTKGLFACGEIIDADGACGGYNLSWAWSSGRCTGCNAVKYLTETDNA